MSVDIYKTVKTALCLKHEKMVVERDAICFNNIFCDQMFANYQGNNKYCDELMINENYTPVTPERKSISAKSEDIARSWTII